MTDCIPLHRTAGCCLSPDAVAGPVRAGGDQLSSYADMGQPTRPNEVSGAAAEGSTGNMGPGESHGKGGGGCPHNSIPGRILFDKLQHRDLLRDASTDPGRRTGQPVHAAVKMSRMTT